MNMKFHKENEKINSSIYHLGQNVFSIKAILHFSFVKKKLLQVFAKCHVKDS